MKTAIITVAGMSARFSKSVGQETLKCLYTDAGPQKTIIARLIMQLWSCDKIIIVGGYKYDMLCSFLIENFDNDKIEIVKNNYFSEYGSGYSLLLGLQKAMELKSDEILFCEGDLVTDEDSIRTFSDADSNVITYNHEIISAKKSVVFYKNIFEKLKYIYDTNHGVLTIDEEFLEIYNSAQMWKMIDMEKVQKALSDLGDASWKRTNLEFIQYYFGEMDASEYSLVECKKWFNCNTIDDYIKAFESV